MLAGARREQSTCDDHPPARTRYAVVVARQSDARCLQQLATAWDGSRCGDHSRPTATDAGGFHLAAIGSGTARRLTVPNGAMSTASVTQAAYGRRDHGRDRDRIATSGELL